MNVHLTFTGEGLVAIAPPTLAPKSQRGSENVLLVEDSEPVRTLVSWILQNCGYGVTEAGTGDEALSQYKQRQGPIDLLLTDVMMPNISGPELAKQVSALDPSMKVLYMSGHTAAAMVQNGVLNTGAAYIQKPFTPDALVRKVRDVMDA
jgi:two-component system cell cycle sensor histidine kinase/response regulator CckA